MIQAGWCRRSWHAGGNGRAWKGNPFTDWRKWFICFVLTWQLSLCHTKSGKSLDYKWISHRMSQNIVQCEQNFTEWQWSDKKILLFQVKNAEVSFMLHLQMKEVSTKFKHLSVTALAARRNARPSQWCKRIYSVSWINVCTLWFCKPGTMLKLVISVPIFML